MSKPSNGVGSSSASEQSLTNLAAELDRLRDRRDRLEAEVRNDRGMVGDHGDAAEAIQRANELAELNDRVHELDHLVRTGLDGVAATDGPPGLPGGTEVTLKFPDGDVVTMRVISIIEEALLGGEIETLTAHSPLGLALVGAHAGETISYATPHGESSAELLSITLPG